MEKRRRPRWRDMAHLRLPIPRGRTIEHSARDLETLLWWSATAADNSVTRKTWFVPSTPTDLNRAIADARRLGAAGIEVRSDVFDGRPELADSVDLIASLRHAAPSWLSGFPGVHAWDIDVEYASEIEADQFNKLPDWIILSAHPDGVHRGDLDRLAAAHQRLADILEVSTKRIELKYAPSVLDFDEFATLLDMVPALREMAPKTTVLPTSRDFAWARPIFAEGNATNYLPVGLRSRDPDHPTPTDFNEMLPHLAGPAPTRFDALLGHPVHSSQGALWHRRASLLPRRRGSGGATATSMGAHNKSTPHTSYLLIPTHREDFDDALKALEPLPIRGLSITSPLKRKAADSPRISASDALPALNTLRRAADDDHRPWTGTDTDTEGMIESLKWFESNGVGPGRAVVFGRGGASHAILRGLNARGWELVAHLSARKGWSTEHRQLEPIDLIVHAAGPQVSRSEHTPSTRAWLDLHYVDVAEPPPDTLHLQGDRFFAAQAEAQRRFWE